MKDPGDYFRRPKHPLQARYEALRAVFVDDESVPQVAPRFGYKPASLHVLCSLFRRGELDPFLSTGIPGAPPRAQPEALEAAVLELRRQKLSILEIPRDLARRGFQAGPSTVYRILSEHGVARLAKRPAKERRPLPLLAKPTADVDGLDLTVGRTFESDAALLLLFAPFLSRLDLDGLVQRAGYPGTSMLPASHVQRSLLALKLLQRSRRSHVRNRDEDEGVGLFAGLNVVPKVTKLHDWSYEAKDTHHRDFLEGALRGLHHAGWFHSTSFNLDTHAIRHWGEKAVLEKNYVPRRSQSTRSVLAVYAQELDGRSLVWATADALKGEKVEAVVEFIEYWTRVSGAAPEELVFDSKLTTLSGLGEIARRGIRFLTLRARHPAWVKRVRSVPDAKWARARIEIPGRKYRHPRVLDESLTLKEVAVDGEKVPLRQLVARDLGKESPMFLLTNDVESTPSQLLTRYALRTPIENSIGEQVHFFHVDALSSSVRLKVDHDVALDVVASQCYRWFQSQLRGFERVSAATIWNLFLDRGGTVTIGADEVVVRVRPFSHAPIIASSPLAAQPERVPWLGNRRVRVEFKR